MALIVRVGLSKLIGLVAINAEIEVPKINGGTRANCLDADYSSIDSRLTIDNPKRVNERPRKAFAYCKSFYHKFVYIMFIYIFFLFLPCFFFGFISCLYIFFV